MTEIKAFNKWSVHGIEVKDLGLKDYISLNPKIVPRTGASYAKNRFYKSRVFIVERLMNKIMVPGHRGKKHKMTSGPKTGKSLQIYAIVENSFRMVEQRTKENPVKVLVKAIENAAPREEIISIEYGGARYPKAVECAPQRRIDVALRHMTHGAFSKSFNAKKSYVECLTEEIMNAYYCLPASNAVSKKLELERQADGSR